MILSKPQREIAEDPHRFKVAICGRRFGKTYLAIRQICFHAKDPNKEIFYITSSYRAAKMIVWKPLKRRLQDLKWAKKINEAELSILLKNGSTISLKRADNPDALRGPSLSYVVIDEAAEVDSELWFEVIRPALADQQGGALFIGTPKGKGNWTYDLFCQQDSYPEAWRSWQFTTLDGGRVTAEEIESAKRDMSERQFRQEFMATFETYENRVAWAFNRTDNVKDCENPDTSIIYIGLDFNVSPLSAAICVRKGDDLHVIDEILIHNSHTQEMADEIKRRYPKSKIFVYPDPSGSARKTSANGMTDHTILTNAGFIVKAPHKHDPVRDRINAINARFCSADGVRHLFVAKTCKYTIDSLDKYTFKEGTQVPDKDSGLDHIFDALSYAVAYMFPLRREVDPTKTAPSRWGHKLQPAY
jgi:phage terminase large subunit